MGLVQVCTESSFPAIPVHHDCGLTAPSRGHLRTFLFFFQTRKSNKVKGFISARHREYKNQKTPSLTSRSKIPPGEMYTSMTCWKRRSPCSLPGKLPRKCFQRTGSDWRLPWGDLNSNRWMHWALLRAGSLLNTLCVLTHLISTETPWAPRESGSSNPGGLTLKFKF